MNKARVVWCDQGWMPTHYGFCPSETAWKREMRRLSIQEAPPYPMTDASTTIADGDNGSTVVLVTLDEKFDKNKDKIGVICLLVHEAAHVWQAIREAIQEDAPSKEFEAYALQNISSQLLLAYSETRRKI